MSIQKQPQMLLQEQLLEISKLHAAGQRAEASKQTKQLLKKFPENALLLQTQGILYAEQGDYRSAIDLMEKSVALEEKNPIYHLNLAKTYFSNQELKKAARYFAKTLELAPENQEAMHYLQDLAQQKIDFKLPLSLAKQLLKKLSAIAPSTNNEVISKQTQCLASDWDSFLVNIHSKPCQQEKRILVVDWRVPTPDLDSGSFRMNKILKSILKLGYKLYFVGDTPAPSEHYAQQLRNMGIEVMLNSNATIEFLMREGSLFSTVFLSRPAVTQSYLPIVRALAPYATILYDTVDLHWVRFQRGADVAIDESEKTKLITNAEYFKRLERANTRAADLTIAITPEEKEILQQEIPGAKVAVLPNIHDVFSQIPGPTQRKHLFFIGGFSHIPNIEAVLYFVNEVFPLVQKFLPEVNFYIVGSDMPDIIRNCASENIKPIGYVEDIEPFFFNLKVFVAPLLHGAGMKGKVGQSLGYGLPVVTTPIGAEGIGLTHKETAMIVDDAASFAASIVELYQDDELWKQLSIAGRKLIAERFSEAAVHAQLKEILSYQAPSLDTHN